MINQKSRIEELTNQLKETADLIGWDNIKCFELKRQIDELKKSTRSPEVQGLRSKEVQPQPCKNV